MRKNIAKNHRLNTKIDIKILLVTFSNYNAGSPKGRTYFELYYPQTSGEWCGQAGHTIFKFLITAVCKTVQINIAL